MSGPKLCSIAAKRDRIAHDKTTRSKPHDVTDDSTASKGHEFKQHATKKHTACLVKRCSAVVPTLNISKMLPDEFPFYSRGIFSSFLVGAMKTEIVSYYIEVGQNQEIAQRSLSLEHCRNSDLKNRNQTLPQNWTWPVWLVVSRSEEASISIVTTRKTCRVRKWSITHSIQSEVCRSGLTGPENSRGKSCTETWLIFVCPYCLCRHLDLIKSFCLALEEFRMVHIRARMNPNDYIYLIRFVFSKATSCAHGWNLSANVFT